MARQLFGTAVDYGVVKVHNEKYLWFGMQPDDTAITPNGELYFSPKRFREDFSTGSYSDSLWFMHEMVHVWQYQLGYPVKARGAIRIGVDYHYELAPDKQLSDYNMEAQGDLLSDYWALKSYPHPPLHNNSYRDKLPLYETVLRKFIADPADKGNLP
ncbi:MAG: Rhs element Vgr protein [Proteobacteria bacterium]|nr:Rhs element Vgr protein [Pseudomonadota bacterium]